MKKFLVAAFAVIMGLISSTAFAGTSCFNIYQGVNCGVDFVMNGGACATGAQVTAWDGHCGAQPNTVDVYCLATNATDPANQPNRCTCTTGYAYSTSTWSCSNCASGWHMINGVCVQETAVLWDSANDYFLGETGPGSGIWDTVPRRAVGNLSDQLTGTVSLTTGTAAVSGVGTSFTTEIGVGDAIKITDGTNTEIFTVLSITDNLNLTVDSNAVNTYAGDDAYTDEDMFAILTGDLDQRMLIGNNIELDSKTGYNYLRSDIYADLQIGTRIQSTAQGNFKDWSTLEVDAISGGMTSSPASLSPLFLATFPHASDAAGTWTVGNGIVMGSATANASDVMGLAVDYAGFFGFAKPATTGNVTGVGVLIDTDTANQQTAYTANLTSSASISKLQGLDLSIQNDTAPATTMEGARIDIQPNIAGIGSVDGVIVRNSGSQTADTGIFVEGNWNHALITDVGKVGINTSTPTALMAVDGPVVAQGSSSVSTNDAFEISRKVTSFGRAMNIQTIWDYPAAGGGISGAEFNTQTDPGNANNMTGQITGVLNRAEHLGSGTANYVVGAQHIGGAREGGTVTQGYGEYAAAVANDAAMTTGYGFSSQNATFGTGTMATSFGFRSFEVIGTGFTNNVGLATDNMSAGTNNTNLLIGTSTPPTGDYSIYLADGSHDSFIGTRTRFVVTPAGVSTNGRAIDVYSNAASAGALVNVRQDNAAGGLGMVLDVDSTGDPALYVTSDATTANAVAIDANALTSGVGFDVDATANATGARAIDAYMYSNGDYAEAIGIRSEAESSGLTTANNSVIAEKLVVTPHTTDASGTLASGSFVSMTPVASPASFYGYLVNGSAGAGLKPTSTGDYTGFAVFTENSGSINDLRGYHSLLSNDTAPVNRMIGIEQNIVENIAGVGSVYGARISHGGTISNGRAFYSEGNWDTAFESQQGFWKAAFQADENFYIDASTVTQTQTGGVIDLDITADDGVNALNINMGAAGDDSITGYVTILASGGMTTGSGKNVVGHNMALADHANDAANSVVIGNFVSAAASNGGAADWIGQSIAFSSSSGPFPDLDTTGDISGYRARLTGVGGGNDVSGLVLDIENSTVAATTLTGIDLDIEPNIAGIGTTRGMRIFNNGSQNGDEGIYIDGSWTNAIDSRTTLSTGVGLFAQATATGAVTNYGGRFIAAGDNGRAVQGEASSTAAAVNYGGYFSAWGQGGRGVEGRAQNSTGLNYGGYFRTNSGTGYGVWGEATATGAVGGVGLYGRSAGDNGIGVQGYASAVNGYAIYGAAAGSNGRAIYTNATNATGWSGYFQGGRGIYAQNGAFVGTSSPDASALVQMNSTSKGLLIPRMTNAQILAIASPADGLRVHSTTNDMVYVYDSGRTKWLSEEVSTLQWGESGNTDGEYMSFGGIMKIGTSGARMPYDGTIIRVTTMASGGDTTKAFDIEINGTAQFSYNLAASVYTNTGVNTNFSVGDYINHYCSATGAAVTDPATVAWVKWRL